MVPLGDRRMPVDFSGANEIILSDMDLIKQTNQKKTKLSANCVPTFIAALKHQYDIIWSPTNDEKWQTICPEFWLYDMYITTITEILYGTRSIPGKFGETIACKSLGSRLSADLILLMLVLHSPVFLLGAFQWPAHLKRRGTYRMEMLLYVP